jgi:hypothetical protein
MLPIRRCRAPASAGGGEQRGRGERFAEPRPENRAGDAEIGQISVTNRTDIGHKSDGYRSVGDGPGLSYSNIRRARCSLSKTATCRFPNPLGVASMLARGEARCSLAGEARCAFGRAGTGVLHAERAWPGRGDRGAGGVRRRGNPAPRRHEQPDPPRQGGGLGHGSSGARCSWGGRLADVSMRTPHEACRAPGTGVSGHGLE